MARHRPPNIIENILSAGETVVTNDGYAASSIATIAKTAEIGVGSVYHYFADKDALLDWVVIRVLRPDITLPSDLPLTAPPMSIEEAVAPYLNVHVSLPLLHQVSSRAAETPIADELRLVIREFCDLVERTDRVQTMVEVCSNDLETLRRAWYLDYRRALVAAYETYFRRRISEGAMRSIDDPRFAARWLLDTVILFIRLRRLDHYPDELPTLRLTDHVVDMLTWGLAGSDSR
jgi:AcrR family transcriptional regulator